MKKKVSAIILMATMVTKFCSRQTMYWQKSCVCYRNWKSSLHGSRWLILIGFLKIIGYRLPELSIYKGRLKSKKQPAQPIFLAKPLTPTATPSSLPVGESQREGNKPQGLYFRRFGN